MVQQVKVKSSKELYDNRNDESRVYDIEANVHISDASVSSMDNGRMYKDGAHVADFNIWDVNNMSVTYINVELDERNAINEAVSAFIAEVKAVVAG